LGETLANRIVTVLTNSDLVHQMGEKACARAEQEFELLLSSQGAALYALNVAIIDHSYVRIVCEVV
jgi:hypothetical protein